MGYRTNCVTKFPPWQTLLVNAAAVLFMATFLAHAVIAGGMLSHSPVPEGHGHGLFETGDASAPCDVPIPSGAASASAIPGHDHGNGSEAPPCCGDLCHLALAPQEISSPVGVAHREIILIVSKPLLRGRALEGPRRPPRLSV